MDVKTSRTETAQEVIRSNPPGFVSAAARVAYDVRVVETVGMTRQGSGSLGPLEGQVMEVLWAAGEPLSVRAVLEDLNGARDQALAYTTVMTVMARLAEKDVLRRTMNGKGYVYEPAVGDQAGIAVREVLRD